MERVSAPKSPSNPSTYEGFSFTWHTAWCRSKIIFVSSSLWLWIAQVTEDVANEHMGVLKLEDFDFSEQVKQEWSDPQMYQKLLSGETFVNPEVTMQVKA